MLCNAMYIYIYTVYIYTNKYIVQGRIQNTKLSETMGYGYFGEPFDNK